MDAWEKWLYNGEEENDSLFPCLRQLIVERCPKLKGGCTLILPSLFKINIHCCNEGFLKCLAKLTSITKMAIREIHELVHFEGSLSTSWTALEEMRIERCPQFKFIVGGGGGKQVPPNLKVLQIVDCGELEELVHFEGSLSTSWTALEEMRIERCPQFKFIVGGDGGKQVPPNLKVLQIVDCGEFEKLVHFEGSLSTSWTALEEIRIKKCLQFKFIVGGNGGKRVQPNLKVLEIEGCGELEKLADDLYGLTSLSEMIVAQCYNLFSFPSGGLPSSLRRLTLFCCPILPQSQLISIRLLDYLEELTLWDMEGLMSITELVGVGSPLSLSLRELKIQNCRSLTTLTDSLQHLSALSDLNLWDCPALETEIFPSLPRNLSSFKLVRCPNVKSLPYNMHHLTSLKSLYIYDCQGITRGLPPNLESLSIGLRNLNQRIEEWGLRGLTALRSLSISGEYVDEMECFPPSVYDAGWSRLLPSSLLHLTIWEMKKLERVGGGLRHHLTSIQSLFIGECDRLRHLPDDGFPDSLGHLAIIRCTKELWEKCRKGEGEYWHSHLRLIPVVII